MVARGTASRCRLAALLASALATGLTSPAFGKGGASAGQPFRDARLTLLSEQTEKGPGEVVPAGGTIPYKVGTSCYNWRLEFAPFNALADVDEVLTLPAPAAQWNSDAQTQVNDRRTAGRTRITVDGRGGLLKHGWCVASGDPVGIYRYELYVGTRQIGSVSFRLSEAP